ncbi:MULTISPECIES: anti-sigma B factor RsbW [Aneurinibacillus]|jgi:serine/threonine-protein kinase RsbW|uniref:Serine-protein kinase RsbW n=1 Tax=Aneurinibacillus danicus TaxID=267746 RepID=A0A511V281_9BACL|nr:MULTISPECIES: anti-sigma B factor RsbW [Aneurinibacillus]GEN32979.1 serine-protein kinase RsbW [Aneurinibacillus danicus]
MPELNDHVKINVPARADYISVIRLTVSGLAYQMGFTYNDIEDIKVALAEACNNVVSHAYKNSEVGEISVDFHVEVDRLQIIVSDEGAAFDAKKLKKEASSLHGKSLDEIDVGGLGIYLMKTLMDEIEYDTGEKGVKVSLTKYLKRDEVSESEPNVHQEIIQP